MKDQVIEEIMKEEQLSRNKAKSYLDNKVEQVLCIIALYHYYEWAIPKLKEVKNVVNIEHICSGKPYYKVDPILNIKSSDIVQLSSKSLFREFAKESGCKYKLEQLLFCSKSEIRALNRVLNKVNKEVKNETNNH